jgi:hypothetical protein
VRKRGRERDVENIVRMEEQVEVRSHKTKNGVLRTIFRTKMYEKIGG